MCVVFVIGSVLMINSTFAHVEEEEDDFRTQNLGTLLAYLYSDLLVIFVLGHTHSHMISKSPVTQGVIMQNVAYLYKCLKLLALPLCLILFQGQTFNYKSLPCLKVAS